MITAQFGIIMLPSPIQAQYSKSFSLRNMNLLKINGKFSGS